MFVNNYGMDKVIPKYMNSSQIIQMITEKSVQICVTCEMSLTVPGWPGTELTDRFR